MNPADHDLNGTVSHIIQELTVVGNEYKGTTIILQISFEPFNTLNIKMVGRLVKKKDIRLGKKYLCKLDTHVPALTESLCRP